MFINDCKVLIAGVDVSFLSATVTPTEALITLQYSDFFEDQLQRTIPGKDLRTIVRFEQIPVMVIAKHPKQGINVDKENGIIIFEGLAQSIKEDQVKNTDSRTVVIRALKTSMAVLGNIKYSILNIGSAYNSLTSAKNLTTQKVVTEQTGNAKVVAGVDNGVNTNSVLFLRKILTGSNKVLDITQPHQVYEATLNNLLTPLQSQATFSNDVTVALAPYFLANTNEETNIFLPADDLKSINLQYESLDTATSRELNIKYYTFVLDELDSFFKNSLGTGDKKALNNQFDTWLRIFRGRDTRDETISTFRIHKAISKLEFFKTLSGITSTSDLESGAFDFALISPKIKQFVDEEDKKKQDFLKFVKVVNNMVAGAYYITMSLYGLLDIKITKKSDNFNKPKEISRTSFLDFFVLDNIPSDNTTLTSVFNEQITKLNMSLNVVEAFLSVLDTMFEGVMAEPLISNLEAVGPISTEGEIVVDTTQMALNLIDLYVLTTYKNIYLEDPDNLEKAVGSMLTAFTPSESVTGKYFGNVTTTVEKSGASAISKDSTEYINYLFINGVIEDLNSGQLDIRRLMSAVVNKIKTQEYSASERSKIKNTDVIEEKLLLIKDYITYVNQYIFGYGMSVDKVNSEDIFTSEDEEERFRTVQSDPLEAVRVSESYKEKCNEYRLGDNKSTIMHRNGSLAYVLTSVYDSLKVAQERFMAILDTLSRGLKKKDSDGSSNIEGVESEVAPINFADPDLGKIKITRIKNMIQKFLTVKKEVKNKNQVYILPGSFKLEDYLAAKNINNYRLINRFNTLPNLKNLDTGDMFPTMQLSNFLEYQKAISESLGRASANFSVWDALNRIYSSMLYGMHPVMNSPVYNYEDSSKPEVMLLPKDQYFIPPRCNVYIDDSSDYSRSMNSMYNTTAFIIRSHLALELTSGAEASKDYIYDIYNPKKIEDLQEYNKRVNRVVDNEGVYITNKRYYGLENIGTIDLKSHLDFLKRIKSNTSGGVTEISSKIEPKDQNVGGNEVLDLNRMVYFDSCGDITETEVVFRLINGFESNMIFSTIDKLNRDEETGKSLLSLPSLLDKSNLFEELDVYSSSPMFANSSSKRGFYIYKGFGIPTAFKRALPEGKFRQLNGNYIYDDNNSTKTEDVDYVKKYFDIEGSTLKTSINIGIFYNILKDYDEESSEPVYSVSDDSLKSIQEIMDLVSRLYVHSFILATNRFCKDSSYTDAEKIVFVKLVEDLIQNINEVNLFKYLGITNENDSTDIEVTWDISKPAELIQEIQSWRGFAKYSNDQLTILQDFIINYLANQKLILKNLSILLRYLSESLFLNRTQRLSNEKASYIGTTKQNDFNFPNKNTLQFHTKNNIEDYSSTAEVVVNYKNTIFNFLCELTEDKSITSTADAPKLYIVSSKKIRPSMAAKNNVNFASASTLVDQLFMKKGKLNVEADNDNLTNLIARYKSVRQKMLSINRANPSSEITLPYVLASTYMVVNILNTSDTSSFLKELKKYLVTNYFNMNLDGNLFNYLTTEGNYQATNFINAIGSGLASIRLKSLHSFVEIENNLDALDDPSGITMAPESYYTTLEAPVDFTGDLYGGVKQYRVSEFLKQRSTKLHNGIDYSPSTADEYLADNPGIPVRAVYDGYVVFMIEKGNIWGGSKIGYGMYAILIPELTEAYKEIETPMFIYGHLHPINTINNVLKEIMTLDVDITSNISAIHKRLTTADYHEKDIEKTMLKFFNTISFQEYYVRRGDIIGYMGDSGTCRSSVAGKKGTHLHLTCYKVPYPGAGLTAGTIKSLASTVISKNSTLNKEYLAAYEQISKNAGLTEEKKKERGIKLANKYRTKYMEILYNPELVGKYGFTGFTETSRMSSSQEWDTSSKKFRGLSLSSISDIKANLVNRQLPKVENVVIEANEMLENLKFFIHTSLMTKMFSIDVAPITLPYYDPYFIDGNMPFAILRKKDIIFTRLMSANVSTTTSNLTQVLQLTKGFSLRTMLYYYLSFLNVEYVEDGNDIGNVDLYIGYLKENMERYPMYPPSIIEDYNIHLNNLDSMNQTYSSMFGKQDFAFNWQEHVYLKVTSKNNKSYIVRFSELLSLSMKEEIKQAVKDSFENPYFLFNLLDYNNDYLQVDYDRLLIDNYKEQNVEENLRLSIYRDGENKMLMNWRAWRADRLYTPTKWLTQNFKYNNLELTDLNLSSRYMDLFKPRCENEERTKTTGLDMQSILSGINNTTGAQWQNAPLLYQNWFQIFLNIRDKSFKK